MSIRRVRKRWRASALRSLIYARRYALFALVGIAGEDDLDAPDLSGPTRAAGNPPRPQPQSRRNGSLHKPQKPILPEAPSAALRDQLVGEIRGFTNDDDLALWALRRLPAKNTLTAGDAGAVELAYRAALDSLGPDGAIPLPEPDLPASGATLIKESANGGHPSIARTVSPIRKELRRRNKAHLAFVGAQSCLVCQRRPCDAHHLKFAQPRALGRKVSDEFTVPLCREHHYELHRHGSETAWWPICRLPRLKRQESFGRRPCFRKTKRATATSERRLIQPGMQKASHQARLWRAHDLVSAD